MAGNPGSGAVAVKRKLSYKEQRELEALPARIQALEDEQQRLRAESESAEFYRAPGPDSPVLGRLEQIGPELEAALARWIELEERSCGDGRGERPQRRSRSQSDAIWNDA